MHNLKQALQWLCEGKKVQGLTWEPDQYIYYSYEKDCLLDEEGDRIPFYILAEQVTWKIFNSEWSKFVKKLDGLRDLHEQNQLSEEEVIKKLDEIMSETNKKK